MTRYERIMKMTLHPDGTAAAATHYQILEQQPIEIMQRLMTDEAFLGFCHGNVIKYALRCGHKDDPVKEMEKVMQYADWYVRAARGETIDPKEKTQAETIGPGCYMYAAPKAQEGASWVDCVKEFFNSYDVPRPLNGLFSGVHEIKTARKTQMKLINEENEELNDAFLKWDTHADIGKDAILDAICDSIYVLIGLALQFGFDLDGAFHEVHRSNMSKLGEDGKPIKRDDGKVLKGPNFTPPDLTPYL